MAMPQIVRRAGLDLNPLDAADPAAAAWLETLVWSEQTDRLDRLARLRAALNIAAAVSPSAMSRRLAEDLQPVESGCRRDRDRGDRYEPWRQF
jgi:hypothetical protein